MLSSRFAGIPVLSSPIDEGRTCFSWRSAGSRRRGRNRASGGRLQIGTAAGFKSAGLNRNSHLFVRLPSNGGYARRTPVLPGLKPLLSALPAQSGPTIEEPVRSRGLLLRRLLASQCRSEAKPGVLATRPPPRLVGRLERGGGEGLVGLFGRKALVVADLPPVSASPPSR